MTLMDLMADYSTWIVVVLAGLAAVAALLRKVGRKIKALLKRGNLAVETLLGRDEIRHPDTGMVLVSATPNLGSRFAHIEEAIVKMSDTTIALHALTGRVDSLATTLHTHIRVSEGEGAVQRKANSDEQTAMWGAMQAVAESTPAPSEPAGPKHRAAKKSPATIVATIATP